MAIGFIDRTNEFRRIVVSEVSGRLHRAGAAGVAEAVRLVPVDTGQTQRSIGYTVDESRLLLQIHADTPWAVWVELGSRRIPARPFLRPGMAKAAEVFGGSGQFSGEIQLLGTPAKYQAGLYAHHGTHTVIQRKRSLVNLFRRKRTARYNFGH